MVQGLRATDSFHALAPAAGIQAKTAVLNDRSGWETMVFEQGIRQHAP
jgi:hypothetical protein